MPILLDKQHFYNLFKNINTLTQAKLSFFDENFNHIISYPKSDCAFCKLIKNNPYGNLKCAQSKKNAFLSCRESKKDITYSCHAGVTQTIIPIIEAEKITGYIMFGQAVRDNDFSFVWESCKRLDIEKKLLQNAFSQLEVMNPEKISSACEIIKMCSIYLFLYESISASRSQQIQAFKKYISENLSSNLTVSKICKHLNISRTSLYELVKKELDTGVSEYITLKRIQRAKNLLLSTDMSISQVAEAVGVSDYNYFSKYFKAKTGLSPSKWRALG